MHTDAFIGQKLSEVPRQYWKGAVVWVDQKYTYKADVLNGPLTERRNKYCRRFPERAFVRPVGRPGLTPKWVPSPDLTVVQLGVGE